MRRKLRGFIALMAAAFLLLGVAVAASAAPKAESLDAAGGREARIEVDLSDRKLRTKLGDETVATYSIAIGKEGHRTPTGAFRIRRIVWNPSWTPPDSEWARDKRPTPPGDPDNPMGRVKIFFAEPDYYIHGTSDAGSIGRAASHGCIRMTNDAVVEVARFVMENGGEPRDPGWFRRILNRVRDTREVRLSKPV